jgi:hypothetical protein
MHATTHKHSPSSATPVTPLPAGAESADALGGFSPPPRVPQGGSENRGSGGLPRLRGGSGWPLQGGPRGLRPRPATPENPPRPPASGGPKIGEISDFLPPSGAKSWGSGGAPPTNLILLRNQPSRAYAAPHAAPRPRRPAPRPHPAPPGPPGPARPRGGWWLAGGGGGGGVGDWGGETGGGRGGPLSSMSPSEGGFTSVCAGSDCGASLCPDDWFPRRSYRVPRLTSSSPSA